MEFIFEIFIRRIIVKTFGYYTLLFYYKITRNKQAIDWLKKTANNEGEELGKGCLISVVGLISFTTMFLLIGFVVMKIQSYF